MLQQQYENLQRRYTALFRLNQLSQECEDLNDFYPQVHRTITSLMTAVNFFIVGYDQAFSTMEFVYYVDEKDQKPEVIIDYSDFSGSLTHLVIESIEPLLVTPALEKQLVENDKVALYGSSGSDWLGFLYCIMAQLLALWLFKVIAKPYTIPSKI